MKAHSPVLIQCVQYTLRPRLGSWPEGGSGRLAVVEGARACRGDEDVRAGGGCGGAESCAGVLGEWWCVEAGRGEAKGVKPAVGEG